MKWIIMLLLILPLSISAQVIGKDKQGHFIVGGLVSASTYALTLHLTKDKKKAKIISLSASVLVGLAKELIDEKTYGGFDGKDLLATSIGGVTVSYSLDLLFKKKLK